MFVVAQGGGPCRVEPERWIVEMISTAAEGLPHRNLFAVVDGIAVDFKWENVSGGASASIFASQREGRG